MEKYCFINANDARELWAVLSTMDDADTLIEDVAEAQISVMQMCHNVLTENASLSEKEQQKIELHMELLCDYFLDQIKAS